MMGMLLEFREVEAQRPIKMAPLYLTGIFLTVALCVFTLQLYPSIFGEKRLGSQSQSGRKPRCLNRFACCIKYQLWDNQMSCALFRSVKLERERMDESASIMSIPSPVQEDPEVDPNFDFEFLDEIQGLSQWELLHSADADSEYHHLGEKRTGEEALNTLRNGDSPVTFVPTFEEIGNNGHGVPVETNSVDHDLLATNDDCDDEDHDTDDGDKYDLDDELIPWSVSSKFRRHRMRKIGKRPFPKMLHSKRSPYLSVRPGCVRGKHGLGLKHNY